MRVKRIHRILIIVSSAGVMLASGILFYYLNYNTKMVAKRYLYNDPGLMVSSKQSGLSISNAMNFYHQKKYDKAHIVINGLLQNDAFNDTLQYYNAVTLVKLNNWEEAIPYFEQVALNQQSVFKVQATYLLGLMYWSSGEVDKARPIFESLASQPLGRFRNLSIQILSQL